MFRCQQCGRQSGKNEKSFKKILKEREVKYFAADDKRKEIPISMGKEIVEEIQVGSCCI
jgi:hypothetical protein